MNQQLKKSYDFIIVGGGIVGTTIARALSKYNSKILLIDKESSLGMHTSSRNSSVIHSGIYYATDSLKANLCKTGNKALHAYIEENNLPIKKTGKFIVATNDQEYEQLLSVKKQAQKNGIEIQWVPIEQAIQQEPTLKLYSKSYHAIFSPTTSVGCNLSVIQQLEKDLKQNKNVDLLHAKFLQKQQQQNQYLLQTYKQFDSQTYEKSDKINIEAKFLINCAGVYADKVANEFGFCQNYEILPLRGSYLQTNNPVSGLKSLIYPVPPMKGSTVLGTHLTHSMDGRLKLGPNAMPVLHREQYGFFQNNESQLQNQQNEYIQNLLQDIVTYKGRDIQDRIQIFKQFLEIGKSHLKNFGSKNAGSFYRKHAISELKKLQIQSVVDSAGKLTSIFEDQGINKAELFSQHPRPGIRAQLIDIQTREPVNDFILESDYKTNMHLLNVVSPGWTCSIPFAEHICDILKEKSILN